MRVAAMVGAANGTRDGIARAVREGGAELVWVRGPADLERVMSGDKPVRATLLDVAARSASEVVSFLRDDPALHGTPIVGLVSQTTDDAFRTSHALGADDAVMTHDVDAIAQRVRRLAWFDPSRAPVTRGFALVVHPDAHRRRVIGRVLRQARFDPMFASTEQEAAVLAGGLPDLGISILGGDVSETRLLAKLERPDLPCVQLVESSNAASPTRRGMVTLLEAAPADDLLFVVNELCAESVRESRASRRILLGTLCSFRTPGVIAPTVGLTYNVSREGLYVRTLDPPKSGAEQWIELRPPWREHVHLRATIAWSRGPEAWDRGAPAGFGLRIDEAASPPLDLAEYRAGYEELAAAGDMR